MNAAHQPEKQLEFVNRFLYENHPEA